MPGGYLVLPEYGNCTQQAPRHQGYAGVRPHQNAGLRRNLPGIWLWYLFRGILIGLLFGVPAGAVGAMTAQRAYSSGLRAGLLTGLGSSVADCIYACIGAFGLSLISDFLLAHQTVINLLGGAVFF